MKCLMYFGPRATYVRSPWDEVLELISSIFIILGADPNQILAISRVKKSYPGYRYQSLHDIWLLLGIYVLLVPTTGI